MSAKPCAKCKGIVLKAESLGCYDWQGKNIAHVTALSIGDAERFLRCSLELSEKEQTIANLILKEINSRLGFLVNVGSGLFALSRAAGTLSGGEAQRIRSGYADRFQLDGCSLYSWMSQVLGCINAITTS